MKNLFVVSVGQRSRKGALIPIITRFIETESDKYKLRDYFQGLYIGLEVEISEAQKIEIINVPQNESKDTSSGKPKIKNIERFASLKYDISKGIFAELFKSASSARSVYFSEERKLKDSIKKFISDKPWVNHDYGFDLEIEYAYTRAEATRVKLRFDVIEEEVLAMPEISEEVAGDSHE